MCFIFFFTYFLSSLTFLLITFNSFFISPPTPLLFLLLLYYSSYYFITPPNTLLILFLFYSSSSFIALPSPLLLLLFYFFSLMFLLFLLSPLLLSIFLLLFFILYTLYSNLFSFPSSLNFSSFSFSNRILLPQNFSALIFSFDSTLLSLSLPLIFTHFPLYNLQYPSIFLFFLLSPFSDSFIPLPPSLFTLLSCLFFFLLAKLPRLLIF